MRLIYIEIKKLITVKFLVKQARNAHFYESSTRREHTLVLGIFLFSYHSVIENKAWISKELIRREVIGHVYN